MLMPPRRSPDHQNQYGARRRSRFHGFGGKQRVTVLVPTPKATQHRLVGVVEKAPKNLQRFKTVELHNPIETTNPCQSCRNRKGCGAPCESRLEYQDETGATDFFEENE